ncbi:MAG: type I-G CRISPR-associated protein, Cas3-extension family [Euzebya sp.]
MTAIECPALRSDDTLGFLAALGLLELCSGPLGLSGTRLSWAGVGGQAVIEADCENVDDLAERLIGLARDMHTAGRVLPFDHAGLVDRPLSDAERALRSEMLGYPLRLDPLRRDADGALALYRSIAAVEIEGGSTAVRWTLALINQMSDAKGADKQPTRALTPLYAPAGRMTVHQLFRDALSEVVRDPDQVRQALVRWERTEGTGGNLDDRSLRDAAVTSSGVAGNRSVAGGTWLGLMSIPFFRQTGTNLTRPSIVGWESRRRGTPMLRWPIWRTPLDAAAVTVLLAHPAIDRLMRDAGRGTEVERNRRRAAGRDQLIVIGVDAICVAERRALDKSAGALQPPHVVPVR